MALDPEDRIVAYPVQGRDHQIGLWDQLIEQPDGLLDTVVVAKQFAADRLRLLSGVRPIRSIELGAKTRFSVKLSPEQAYAVDAR